MTFLNPRFLGHITFEYSEVVFCEAIACIWEFLFHCFKDGVAAKRQGSYKKRLMTYSLYAWGTPAFVVLLCVMVDHVKKGSIGYGK